MNKMLRKTIIVIAILLTIAGLISGIYTFIYGLESWGINTKVIWGVAIVNFVFWIGNSHSGTLISAILYLFRQNWRHPIHRIAETMTIISIVIAGLFPLVHLGRPWFFYWMLPIPNQTKLWANFKSPLIWDLVAILSYMVLSLLFWILGIVPDIKKLKIRNKKFQSFASRFWTGSLKNWKEYIWAYNIFAGILTFVVISVHSIVSLDFSVTILPLWHSTMLPIYFVVGAIYSGLALVLLVSSFICKLNSASVNIPSTSRTNLSKLILSFCFLLMYFYFLDFFFAYYGQDNNTIKILMSRFKVNYLPISTIMVIQIFALPLLFSFQKIRENVSFQIFISMNIVIGMWLERYLLIIPILGKDIITNEIIEYSPTVVDYLLTLGSIGFFVLAFYLISRIVPLVPQIKD